jgi:D-alanyl-D-alanine endopeptidase (penicillin-binding protein 7)
MLKSLRTAAVVAAWGMVVLGSPAEAAAAEKPYAGKPEVRSAMALVVDSHTGEVIFERNGTSVVPIASITKLMTALVVLDGKQPLDEVVEITAADRWKGKGAHSRIPVGAKITRADLLRLALMASENRAAQTLSRAYPGGKPAFVKTMNAKAKLLGLTQTRFADASGLSNLNVSSARDLSKLINAVSRNETIREYSTLPSIEVRVSRKSTLVYRNTNLLIGKPDWEIRVQKTGYTNDAGECLVMQAVLDERPVNIVLLNSFGKLTRTADARRIRRWMETQKPSAATATATATVSSERASSP